MAAAPAQLPPPEPPPLEPPPAAPPEEPAPLPPIPPPLPVPGPLPVPRPVPPLGLMPFGDTVPLEFVLLEFVPLESGLVPLLVPLLPGELLLFCGPLGTQFVFCDPTHPGIPGAPFVDCATAAAPEKARAAAAIVTARYISDSFRY